MRKRESDGHVTDQKTLESVTRIVTRYYLFPVRKLAKHPVRYEWRRGFQKVEQFQRYMHDGNWKIVGTYYDEGIWAE